MKQVGQVNSGFQSSSREGCLIIAQRFNVGTSAGRSLRPEGTAEGNRTISAVPSGLIQRCVWHPTLKRWAIVAGPSGTEALRGMRFPHVGFSHLKRRERRAPLP